MQSDGQGADLWTELMRATAERLVREKRRPAAVLLAWQCWQLDDAPLADNLLSAAFYGPMKEVERAEASLAAAEFLSETGRLAPADSLMQPLLADTKLSQLPGLGRRAARLSDRRRAAHSPREWRPRSRSEWAAPRTGAGAIGRPRPGFFVAARAAVHSESPERILRPPLGGTPCRRCRNSSTTTSPALAPSARPSPV
ncbi:MAG TPA: hypothetical protein VFA26_20755 [Gemmataceae bacterium]|nr:hypothetical protein [Gemmataceae bacterium]